MKHSLLFLFLLLPGCICPIYGQKSGIDTTTTIIPVDGPKAADGTSFAPNVTPPSPTATSFQRYGDFPVGHTTGVPDISIPIYTINTGKLKLPIHLSYHAGGFKPRDNSGPIGLGWSITAAGWRISRTVVADPDELAGTPSPVMSGSSLRGTTIDDVDGEKRLYQLRLFGDENASGTDMQPDIFNYSFPSGGGKFLLQNLFDGIGNYTGANKPVTVPFRPVKITSNSANFNSGFNYFEIVDEDGVTYRYGVSLDNVDVSETTYPNQRDAGRSFKTSWLLTDIISQGGKERIKIKYKTGIYHTSSSRTDLGSVRSSESDFAGPQTIPSSVTYDPAGTGYSNISISQGITTSTHYVSLIESIEFNNGKVLFGYETSGPMPAIYDAYKLKNVEVYDIGNNLIQKHSFSHANYTDDSRRYKLTKLERFGVPAGTAHETHHFDYTEPPTPAPINPVDLKGIDYWGFYNAKNTNGSLIPGFYKIKAYALNGGFTYYSTGTADRSADPVATNYYILRKITFPTGGMTEFEFEGNKANWGFVATNAGGLRVARVINTVEGVQEIKTYEYGGDGCAGCGSIRLNPFQLESHFTMGYSHREIDLSGGCLPENQFVIKVSSDIVDGSGYFETSPVLYSAIIEHIGSSTSNQGKTSYIYDQPNLVFADTPYARYLSTVDYWKGSNLKEKEIFAYVGGDYTSIRKETYAYNKVYRETLACQYIEQFAVDGETGDPSWAYSACGHTQDAFKVYDYNITTGISQLSEKTISRDGVTTTETYAYPANYNTPIRTTLTNSEGQDVETSYTYPFDDLAYADMVAANVVNLPLKVSTKEGTAATAKKTDYGCASGSWGTSSPCIYVPTQISTQRSLNGFAGTFYSEITFDSYNDRGYPTQYTERNGVRTTLDWSSNPGSVNLLSSMTTGSGSSISQTSSWIYYPLVGARTMTGPDGKVIAYEYDAFNRLRNIRNDDINGPVRSSYCYNFAGQSLSECSGAITTTGVVSPLALSLMPEINDPALPVTMINFSAVPEGQTALLRWSTASEFASSHFVVERGQDGKSWSKLGTVAASRESNVVQKYVFRDGVPAVGDNLYRLKMVDQDGTFAYSRMVGLRFEGKAAIYPNPLVMGEKLYLEPAVTGAVRHVRIYNIQGKLVLSGAPVGNTIQTDGLTAGVYLIQLTASNGVTTIHRVIKQ